MAAQTVAIKGMTVSRLFHRLRVEKKTGTVIFEHENALKKVYFKDGDIIYASSNLSFDWLGEWLVRAGKLTRPQCDASAELVKKTGKKQGAILVELGFLTPQGLVEGVKYQVKQIILGLFTWLDGNYRFDEGALPLADIIMLHMSTGNLILEGVRQLDWQIVRKSLPSLNNVLRPIIDPTALFQSAELSHDQKTVLSLIDGKRSMEEICALSGSGDFNTLKAIYLLLSLGMTEEGEIKSEREMAFAREAIQEAIENKAVEAEAVPPSEMKQKLQKAYDEIEGMNHYQALGINESATAQDIKKAYFKLAKLYHPDRHFEPEMNDMKYALETLFSKITDAYNTLIEQARRDEYDLSRIKGSAKKIEFEEERTNKAANALNQFNRGMKEYKSGNFWSALEAFTWACRLDPGVGRYFYYKGMALSRMPRRGHEAEECFRKAIELEPSKVDYLVELGQLYLKKGLKSRAASMFSDALNWDPDSEKAKMGLIAAGEEEVGSKGGVFKKLFKNK